MMIIGKSIPILTFWLFLLTPYSIQSVTIINRDPRVPIADAGTDIVTYNTVQLDGSGSYSNVGYIVSWEWSLVHRENPAHNRTAIGEVTTVKDLARGLYDVTLTVTNDTGYYDSTEGINGNRGIVLAAAGPESRLPGDVNESARVDIEDAIMAFQIISGQEIVATPLPLSTTIPTASELICPGFIDPTANAGNDIVAYQKARLDGSSSYTACWHIVRWDWELNHREDPDNNRSASGASATVSNLAPGFYDVTLTVTDNGGNTDSDEMVLAVAGRQPGIPGDADQNAKVDLGDIIYILQGLVEERN